MSAYVKKNHVKSEYFLTFRCIEHAKSVGSKKNNLGLGLGRFEIQLLKSHKGEDDPCVVVYGDSFKEAWDAMSAEMDRQEDHFNNTLKLNDVLV